MLTSKRSSILLSFHFFFFIYSTAEQLTVKPLTLLQIILCFFQAFFRNWILPLTEFEVYRVEDRILGMLRKSLQANSFT